MPKPPKPVASPPGGSSSPADVNLAHADGKSPAPTMPHERDEGSGVTGGVPSERVKQGSRDLEQGMRDTSRAEETGPAYDKLKK